MPIPRQLPTIHALAQSLARLIGWLTDLGAIVIMGYIVKCWPDKGGTVSAGLIGSGIALLNDSWEMVSHIDPTDNFTPLSPPRAVLHDLFALAICMGGLMLLLFSDLRDQRVSDVVTLTRPGEEPVDQNFGGLGDGDAWNTKHDMFRAAQWFLASVAICRFIFAVWSACNCSRQRRRRAERGIIRSYQV